MKFLEFLTSLIVTRYFETQQENFKEILDWKTESSRSVQSFGHDTSK